MEPKPDSLTPHPMVRRPWLLPALILVLLTAAALIDRPEPHRAGVESARGSGHLEALGSIETDSENPVRSMVRIQWSTYAGADSYEVRFWSQDMREVSRYPAGSGNTVLLDLEKVWHPVAPSRVIHWRVVALADGEDVASSDLRMLRLP
jgi:hypothetical protein